MSARVNLDLMEKMREYGIPDYMREGLHDYIVHRIPTGSFLTAVLENNLKLACMNADMVNQKCLFNYVNFLFNEAPRICWGSEPHVETWLAERIPHAGNAGGNSSIGT